MLVVGRDTSCLSFRRYHHPDEIEGLVKLHLKNVIWLGCHNLLHIARLGSETASDKSQHEAASANRTETAPAPLWTAQLLCGHYLLLDLESPQPTNTTSSIAVKVDAVVWPFLMGGRP